MTNLKRMIEQADAAEILSERQSLVAELQRLTEEHLATIKPLAKAEQDAETKITQAQEVLQVAILVRDEAMLAHITCSNAFNRAGDVLERKLKETASPLIATFITALRGLYAGVGVPNYNLRPPERFASLEEKQVFDQGVKDAYDKRQQHLARIQVAITKAQGLWREALSTADLVERLNTLRLSAEAEE